MVNVNELKKIFSDLKHRYPNLLDNDNISVWLEDDISNHGYKMLDIRWIVPGGKFVSGMWITPYMSSIPTVSDRIKLNS